MREISLKEIRLARGLGWFSIGLGLTQLLAPRWLERQIGIQSDSTKLMRALGARETATGLLALSQDQPAPSMWGRVAGDAMDLALLGAALKSPDNQKNRLAVAIAMVLGVTALDFACARMLES